MSDVIAERLEAVRAAVARAAARSRRDPNLVRIVAVSKRQPASAIVAAYAAGQRDFGENYVQELVEKAAMLPADIRWHFIGHLQSNKVKQIAAFVHLIHGVDSLKLLQEINKQATKLGRTINCLLQIHIAQEETKFGLDESELVAIMKEVGDQKFPHVHVRGLMGMASFSDDEQQVANEFASLKKLFDAYPTFTILSVGMSGDYELALAAGSTMLRVGSLLFGERG